MIRTDSEYVHTAPARIWPCVDATVSRPARLRHWQGLQGCRCWRMGKVVTAPSSVSADNAARGATGCRPARPSKPTGNCPRATEVIACARHGIDPSTLCRPRQSSNHQEMLLHNLSVIGHLGVHRTSWPYSDWSDNSRHTTLRLISRLPQSVWLMG